MDCLEYIFINALYLMEVQIQKVQIPLITYTWIETELNNFYQKSTRLMIGLIIMDEKILEIGLKTPQKMLEDKQRNLKTN